MKTAVCQRENASAYFSHVRHVISAVRTSVFLASFTVILHHFGCFEPLDAFTLKSFPSDWLDKYREEVPAHRTPTLVLGISEHFFREAFRGRPRSTAVSS